MRRVALVVSMIAACGSKAASPSASAPPSGSAVPVVPAAPPTDHGTVAMLEEGHLRITLPAGWRTVGDERAESSDQHAILDVMFSGKTEDELSPHWRDDFEGYVISAPQPHAVAGVPGSIISITPPPPDRRSIARPYSSWLETSAETCLGWLLVSVHWDDDEHADAAKRAFESLEFRLEPGSYVMHAENYNKDDRDNLPKDALAVVEDVLHAICADASPRFVGHVADPVTIAGASAPVSQLSRAEFEAAIARAGLQKYLAMHAGPWLVHFLDGSIVVKTMWHKDHGSFELTRANGSWRVSRIWPN